MVDLTESDRHRLLSAERRRVTLVALARESTPVDLTALAERVAEHEHGTDDLDSVVVRRVATSLHHSHLPMMDALDVVDYDPDANRVEAFRFTSS